MNDISRSNEGCSLKIPEVESSTEDLMSQSVSDHDAAVVLTPEIDLRSSTTFSLLFLPGAGTCRAAGNLCQQR
jgi:hypothetical protein